jgi:hypothetical protein
MAAASTKILPDRIGFISKYEFPSLFSLLIPLSAFFILHPSSFILAFVNYLDFSHQFPPLHTDYGINSPAAWYIALRDHGQDAGQPSWVRARPLAPDRSQEQNERDQVACRCRQAALARGTAAEKNASTAG